MPQPIPPSQRSLYGSIDDTHQPLANASSGNDVEDECNIQIPVPARDFSFWITLFFFVGPVYIITPFSWVYVVVHVGRLYLPRYANVYLSQPPALWKRILFFYCLFECIFSLYYQWLASVARRTKSGIPKRDVKDLQLVFNRVLQSGLSLSPTPADQSQPHHPDLNQPLAYSDPRAADFRNHFRHWFRGAPWKDITRRSASEWLSWSMFDTKFDVLDDAQKDAVEEATQMLERRAGSKLREEPEDGKEHIVPVTITWDGVVVWSRPAVVYIAGELVNWRLRMHLKRSYGMVLREYEGFQYIIRAESTSAIPEYPPIVILHGLGFGLAQYSTLALTLLKDLPPTQPVLIPLQPHLSHSILHPYHMAPPPPRVVVKRLASLFRQLHWDEVGVTMISHSKGSAVHTWMLKAHPEMIKRSCFMDPVCFCLWEGDLCWNFVYRTPSNGMELILKYFAATEPGIAVAVQRHFDWGANSMWFEDIPRGRDPFYTRFVLGGKDAVIDGWRVRRYLMNHGVKEGLSWDPNGRHAQPIFDERRLQELKEWVLAPEPQPSLLNEPIKVDEEGEVEASVLPN